MYLFRKLDLCPFSVSVEKKIFGVGAGGCSSAKISGSLSVFVDVQHENHSWFGFARRQVIYLLF